MIAVEGATGGRDEGAKLSEGRRTSGEMALRPSERGSQEGGEAT